MNCPNSPFSSPTGISSLGSGLPLGTYPSPLSPRIEGLTTRPNSYCGGHDFVRPNGDVLVGGPFRYSPYADRLQPSFSPPGRDLLPSTFAAGSSLTDRLGSLRPF